MSEFLKITIDLLNGFLSSVFLFIFTLILSIPLGLLFSLGSMSKIKPLKYLIKILIWVLRGTPLLLQIFVIFYVPGLLFNFQWPEINTKFEWFNNTFSTRFIAALIAFIINYAAYFSEIFRGGIESISKGQYEAGQVLGMTKREIFFKVILLQVIKRIIPPMSNEIITLIKDTALANVIAVSELMFRARLQLLNGLIWPIFYAGLFYLLFNGLVSLALSKTEKKLEYFRV